MTDATLTSGNTWTHVYHAASGVKGARGKLPWAEEYTLPPTSPQRTLAAAIIMQALCDLRHTSVAIRRSARSWLMSDGVDGLCTLCGLSASVVRQRVRDDSDGVVSDLDRRLGGKARR